MVEADRWEYLVALDEELLQGAVLLSEWCSLIVRETDQAFVHHAHLATVITAVAGVETYLRSERFCAPGARLCELIDSAGLEDDLRDDLHVLRKYRNRWVHIDEPWEDEKLLESEDLFDNELETMAFFAVRALRRTIYSWPAI